MVYKLQLRCRMFLPENAMKGPIRPMKRRKLQQQTDYIYKYSCAMLNLNQELCELINTWAHKNIPVDALYINENDDIQGYEQIPHVTIKYGIHDSEPTKLIELLDRCGPVNLIFGEINKFDTNPHFDVIKLVVDGKKLRKMNEIISNNMDTTDTYATYSPHVTIAYVKKGSCDHLIPNMSFDKLVDVVSQVYFTTRTGDAYYIGL